jgi:hypothetical protein
MGGYANRMAGVENIGVFIRGKGLARKLPEPIGRRVTGCSETSAYKIQTPGNYPEENIKHSERGEKV